MDNSSPPVLFVVGTAGAGKSSLVTSFQRWSRFLETEVIAVNLDPGAERVHYDAEFDVRDLISLTEVMDEYDLGPNGAQILAADLLAAQAGEVADQLYQCCERPLAKLLLKENSNVIESGEENLLEAIKRMAVIKLSTSVRRVHLQQVFSYF